MYTPKCKVEAGVKSLIILVLIAVTAVAIVASGVAVRGRPRSKTSSERAKNPYHSVAIRYGRPSCPQVRQLSGVRYLSREAPRLPLVRCTVQPCRCHYAHFDDRRVEDRRNPFGSRSAPSHVGFDRRREDRRRVPHRYAAYS